MPQPAGTSLGSYEILDLIGQGGMGEVYRAHDSKLKRDVALKILPDAFSQDPDRVGRFQREAQVLASLNHPNIAAIYDFQESKGLRFLVLELVEGESLAERIHRGPLPINEAVQIALQICEALEAAHEKNIIHRDLKPANVKVTPEGKVKVLDFGLAKALQENPSNVSLSNSPTLSAATNAGVILGTAAYMSPEQARGQATDTRSDVFSFGCVLYEMLTGRQCFSGDTVSDVLASVLKNEVDFSLLPAELNLRTREMLRRALDKNAKRRWHAVADLRFEIEAILADPKGLSGGPRFDQAHPPSPTRIWKYAVGLTAAAVLGGVITAFWYSKPADPLTVTRLSIPFRSEDGLADPQTLSSVVAISPDGSHIAYAAGGRGFIRSISDFSVEPVAGSEPGFLSPTFSPDGQYIAYFSFVDNTLKKVAVNGGAPIPIARIPMPFGVSWYDNWLLFGDNSVGASRIARVSATGGGESETVVELGAGEVVYGPQMLPDERTLLFSVAPINSSNRFDKARIVVQVVGSSERKVLIEGGSDARYMPTGHLIYAQGGSLRAAPFDLKRLEVDQSAAVPIVEGVLRGSRVQSGAAHFAFSFNGPLVYVPGPVAPSGAEPFVGLVDRKGAIRKLNLPPGTYAAPRVSPDGKRLAVGSDDGKTANIWIYDLSGTKGVQQLTFGGANRFPAWTANGERIAFQSDREGDRGIWWQKADGTGLERLTTAEGKTSHMPDSWSRDGKSLSFTIEQRIGDSDVAILSMPGKTVQPLVQIANSFQGRSAFSSDGRWIAYQSNESGNLTYEILVQPYPTTGTLYKLFRGNVVSAAPLWSSAGNELFFLDLLPGVGRINAVTATFQSGVAFGNPTPLPIDHLNQLPPPAPRNYDVMPGGDQFVVVFDSSQSEAQDRDEPTPEIRVMLNWQEELRK